MSIYRIDNSCYIESQLPRKGDYIFRRGDGIFLGDEFFIARFDTIKSAIKAHDHENLEKEAKKSDDINAQFKFVSNVYPSYTLLDKAVKKGCAACTRILINCGAKTDITNHEGKTAEAMAAELGNSEVIAVFEQSKPVKKNLSEKTVECNLRLKSTKEFNVIGNTFWLEMYEGTLGFGPEFQDRASVMISRSVDMGPNYGSTLKVSFSVTELEYKGKKAYQIGYDKTMFSTVILTPSLEKYVSGKDHLFIVKDKEEPGENCTIS